MTTEELELSQLGLYCTSHMAYMPVGTVMVDGGQNGPLCERCKARYDKLARKTDDKIGSKPHPMDKVRKRQAKLQGRVRKSK